MANAKKCDRCGEYYQKVEPSALESLANAISQIAIPVTVAAQISVIEKFLDLCPKCSKSLRRWAKCMEDAENAKETI